MSFANQNVLVLGGSGALGNLLASEFLEAGANVVATARSLKNFEHIPVRAQPMVVDFEDAQSVKDFIGNVKANYASLDVIVIASGQVGFGLLEDSTAEQLEKLMLINYLAPAAIINGLFPLLKEHSSEKACVIGITGVVVEQVFPGMSAYTTSKIALSSYLQSIEKEWRRYKIRSLDVHLGHTETGLASRALFGVAPVMPTGHDPALAVKTIMNAINSDTRVIASGDF